MLIECTAPELDNIVSVGPAKYHFRRKSEDRSTPMLCDVGDTTHAAEILSQSGFVEFRGDLLDDDSDDEEEGTGGRSDPDAVAASRYASMTLEELSAEVKERFGRAPHPQAKPETLAARLLAADDQAK